MDIIKSILHVFKKSDNAFKVMHPETESACITDWNTGIVNTLASTGLSSLVNVLSSDSLLALLIKKVFDATGVKYLLGQNGYVCFGSLVGGLIIQWGISLTDEYGHAWVIFPISFSWDQPIVIPVHYGVNTVWCFVESTQLKKDTAEIVIKNNDGSTKKNQGCAWIAIAK